MIFFEGGSIEKIERNQSEVQVAMIHSASLWQMQEAIGSSCWQSEMYIASQVGPSKT